jgi:hypothetical protein
MKLKKRLRDHIGGYHKFLIDREQLYAPDPNGSLFSTYERATIIRNMIEVNAGIDINHLIVEGTMSKCFPLHEQEKIDLIMKRCILK